MANQPSGQKIPLSLTRCDVDKKGNLSVKRSTEFQAMLNPSEITHERNIRYNVRQTMGDMAADTKFAAMQPDKVTLKLTLDGTGAVPVPANMPTNVTKQIDLLNEAVYNYQGQSHDSSYVRLLWGPIIFYGRLETLSTTYTLFHFSGNPLRAVVSLSFFGYISKAQAEAASRRSSPDMTHVVTVREGDHLPLLCHRIYGDAAYYRDVARVNGLPAVSALVPGTKLRFPPLS